MDYQGRLIAGLVALAVFCFFAMPGLAALDSVSGVNADGTEIVPTVVPGEVAYSLANGFPLWYWDGTFLDDDTPLKLQLCLDQRAEKMDGALFFPCFLEANPGAPVSFPNNFGPEAFWYASRAATTFNSTLNGNHVGLPGSPSGDMLFRGDLEASFGLDLGALDGDQIAFSRIRLRISVPMPGIYEVTHPYGSFIYRLEDVGRRVIDQTQDIGNKPVPAGPPPTGGNFTLALLDGDPPQFPDPFDNTLVHLDFSANHELVNDDGASIGPFLIPVGELALAQNGDVYLADPGTDANPLAGPVEGSPNGDDFFQLELLWLLEADEDGVLVQVDPAARNFVLNADTDSQIVRVDDFQLMGKLFIDLPNLPPSAEPLFAVTAPGRPLIIDVRGHVHDAFIAGTNEYGIKEPLQAIGLPTDPSDLFAEILLATPLTTEGGTVRRVTTVATGVSTFRYVPRADFSGIDSFHYVVQDAGGLISDPAEVRVLVENLDVGQAEYRVRTGQWRIAGSSSFVDDANFITLRGGPRADLSGAGQVALRPSSNSLEFLVKVDPLLADEIIEILIHAGAPGAGGPAIMELFFLSDPNDPFTGTRRGTVTTFVQQPALGILTFADAVDAILAGNAHVRVRTQGGPGGDLRGAIVNPVIASAEVIPDGHWLFEGKSPLSPGLLPSVSVESKNGIRHPGLTVRIR
ncbi:CHRD domain-containing protein [Geoalkalibacter halelectricus]|uniref:CHRD domain-containing protein n=1 Tax=Geoalkalibacter halelectricus TaxID=2847045 RepID=UPI003D226779